MSLATIDLCRVAPWAGLLGEADQALLRRVLRERHVKAGGHIGFRGDPVTHWVGVAEGLVQLSVGSDDGRISALGHVARGEWFDECALLRGTARRYDAIALRDSRLLLLPDEVFHELLRTRPAFNHYVLAMMAVRAEAALDALEGDRLHDCEVRVARCLAALIDPDLHPGAVQVVRLTHGEIGLLSGVSRQRTNCALHSLARRGLVRMNRHCVRVLDAHGLRRFAGLPQKPALQPVRPVMVPAMDYRELRYATA
ncbi:Crp/Fnr family transcriptional regulator [Caldimonas thermodepolymerans]|jgi:cAMP-binding proteins - catabolite gene activator and regulatory subunit of cAMP-dependent protein kinases|nr:Crp/Fnr family transcriptional regulator [Caldimonas thermodepolymerans]QPC29994.1 Crp/Fnr family transcriptional regulator [Caldimonas thermodepolymerans]RDH97616.1 CRP-like cAMP-binding protein [Caldimonas thermodepolymerans]TCP10029.1 CRP-like cAMP-binding protein [Caldimonas thermodepolymerans]UZG42739.1 Crp/Fnr family transcriptional regulator [Caldimonas thermodepolymerans]UZG46410.1 Crp/Fnr family transcriptional regulator [Caldimonas thermodepolymerans]